MPARSYAVTRYQKATPVGAVTATEVPVVVTARVKVPLDPLLLW